MRIHFTFATSLTGIVQIPSSCVVGESLAAAFTCSINSFTVSQWVIFFVPISTYTLDMVEKIPFTIFVSSKNV